MASDPRSANLKDLSPAGQSLHLWLRQFARALKMARLYSGQNPAVMQMRDTSGAALEQMLATHGNMVLRFTPSEIHLDHEVVVKPYVPPPGVDPPPPNPEDLLPFLFYADGIRALYLDQGITRSEFEQFFDAVRQVGRGALSQDDLLTLMWQGNLNHVHVDVVPLEQTIYLSSRRGKHDDRLDSDFRGLAFSWMPSGAEIHADLGQARGPQGLHRDSFDDWELPLESVDPVKAFNDLKPEVEIAQSFLMASWAEERDRLWTEEAPEVLRHMVDTDTADDTRAICARAAMTWVVNAVHLCEWAEANKALAVLKELDPDLSFVREELTAKIKEIPLDDIAERLDEAEPGEQDQFAAIIVGLGPPAIDLGLFALTVCTRSRPRALAGAALSYAAADDPMLLAPALNDPRWFVVRNAIFVLGQIGGPEVVDLLQIASRHPEGRVRRAVVQALGNVPAEQRLPILLSQVDTKDQQLLAATFNMLSRDRNPRALKLLLERFASPNFEYAPEWMLRSYVNVLVDWVDDKNVALLEALLTRGGWLAAPSRVRSAAAVMLRRIGTRSAAAALEAGLRSRHDAVRQACIHAMSEKEQR
jgi:hypothetical protein